MSEVSSERAELARAPVRSAGFFFGGKAIFTVSVPESFRDTHPDVRQHYTFKFIHKEANGGWPECWMAFLLTGPDNGTDYSYLGKWNPPSTLKLSRKSCVGEGAWAKLILERVLACAANDELEKVEAHGWLIMHEGRCCMCGRRLTVPSSIEAGIGPECAGKVELA